MCALLWSTSGLFIKLLDWTPLLITGGRGLFAAVVLFAYRFVEVMRNNHEKPYFSLNLFIAGITYAITTITFVYANKLTTSANAIVLEYSAPIWAGLAGWIIAKEKPRAENWVSMAAMLVGLAIFFRSSMATGRYIGDALAIVSGMLFGVHSVYMRLQKQGHPIDALLLSNILCALFAVPVAVQHPPVLTKLTVCVILFTGIFQIGLSSFFFSYGIKRITGMSAMLTAAIEPVINPLWVFIFTGERPGLSAVIGGAIIIGAIFFSSWIRWQSLKQFYRKITRK
jgi:drug/metabolite transporter (DMT)-like permease